ncbi:hypothetical protein IJV79_04920, partial [bacterium]|nr:hypothetical protein [bacterium]
YGDSAASIYTGINKSDFEYEITLPKNLEGKSWYLVADTAENDVLKSNFAEQGKELKLNGNKYFVKGRSTLLFIEK